MAKRIYDPNDPNAPMEDPLGPQEPGSPTSQAPTAARSALLGQMGPDQPIDDPNTPAPQVGPAPQPLGNPAQPPPQVGPGQSYAAAGTQQPGDYQAPDPPPYANDWPSPAPPAEQTQSSRGINGTPADVAALYAKYKLHTPSAEETSNWLNGTYGDVHSMADIEAQIAASDEAQRARGGSGGGGDDRSRIDALLAKYQSTDDPNYWYNLIQQHGGFDATGASWLEDRIMRGDGALGVRNGTVQKFQDNAGGGGAAPSAGSGGGGSPYRTVAPSPYNENLRQWMMGQLGTLSQPIGADSGELAPAISAYDTQSQRDQQLERDQLAEHAYAGGNLDSGSFDTQIRQGIEGAAGKRANFAGSMVFQANTQRKQQLQAMLQTATNAGLMDQAQKIQQAIAEIDAQLRGDQLGFSYADLMARMNRDAMTSGMNG